MQAQQNRSIFKVIVTKIHHSNLDLKNRTVTSDRPVSYMWLFSGPTRINL